MRIVRLVIHGRVQGVGFRCFIEGEARVSGVEGWVRNRRDGTVEAVLKGDESLLEGIINACRRGPPPLSRVDRVEISDASESDKKLCHPGKKFSALPSA